jgi:hypothetical protein
MVEREARRVLLVGGKADILLRRYFDDALAHELRLDWDKLYIVTVKRNGKLSQLRVIAVPIIGSPTQDAIASAKKVDSADLAGAEAIAQRENYDLVCGRHR